jgi:plastocyanin
MNYGKLNHVITANNGAFDSGELMNGDFYRYTFTETGTFNFRDSYHADKLFGTVKVRR